MKTTFFKKITKLIFIISCIGIFVFWHSTLSGDFLLSFFYISIGLLHGLVILPFQHDRRDHIFVYFSFMAFFGGLLLIFGPIIFAVTAFQNRYEQLPNNYYKKFFSLSEYRKAWKRYLTDN